jgi:hypothetical protein
MRTHRNDSDPDTRRVLDRGVQKRLNLSKPNASICRFWVVFLRYRYVFECVSIVLHVALTPSCFQKVVPIY